MSEHRPRIVIAEPYDAHAVEFLKSIGEVILLDRVDETRLIDAVKDCDALLVRTYVNVTRRVLEHAPKLRVIGRAGVGLDNIDALSARARGITVVYTPAASTDAVADLTVGLMLSVLRRIPEGDVAVRQERFAEARQAIVGRELSELTLGIIGFGRIGRAVARRCRNGFGMNVIYNDIIEPGLLDFTAAPVDKATLFRAADIISLHVPLTDQTRGLINAHTLAICKPDAILINTARGAIVDSLALADALSKGTLAGAGLDVVEPEPLPADHPLLELSQVVFTPHIGAKTHSALARMHGVVEDVARVLRGEAPLYPVPV